MEDKLSDKDGDIEEEEGDERYKMSTCEDEMNM